MKTEQIIKTLQEYNDWRRGKGKWSCGADCGSDYFDTISVQTIGQTIDAAIEQLHKLEQERDQARHIASYWRNMAGTFAISKRKNKFPWEEGSPWEEDS